jgi:hypothetical protein
MAESGKDGKQAFRNAAQRNESKVTQAIRKSMTVGKKQVPAHDASTLLAHIRRADTTIPSDSSHVTLVASIVQKNGWTYKPKSAKK